MNFTEQLQQFLDAEDVRETGFGSSDAFVIENDRQADYAIRKIKEIRKEREAIEAEAEQAVTAYKAKVEQFKESQTKPLDFRESYLSGLLQHYVETKLQGSSKRSVKFIEGTAGFRKKPDAITYDEPIVLHFLEEHPEFAKRFTTTKTVLDKASLRKAGQADVNNAFIVGGVPIPGITIETQPDSFSVK